MRLHTDPQVFLIPVGNIATATEVQIVRGSQSTIRSIDEILPSKNKVLLPEDVMKQEIIRRAWLLGTVNNDGSGNPIMLQNPSLKTSINSGTATSGIYSGKGRMYIGDVTERADGMAWVPWGPGIGVLSFIAEIPLTELVSPNPEDSLETAIQLIPGYLRVLNGTQKVDGEITINTATRLYQEMVDLVATYQFRYLSF